MAARHVAHRVRYEISPPAVRVSAGSVPPAVLESMRHAVGSGIEDITVIAMTNGRLLYRADSGTAGPETRYPVASASKWLTAALVMTVVDEGKLTLDTPVSQVLPEFTGESGRITLRMLLAQTAGLGSLRSNREFRQSAHITLAQAAAAVAGDPPANPPGSVFEYGGPGFQVAGAMVEKVTGKRWSDLFEERIAQPLGMTATRWERLPNHGVSAADTLNPLLQGGAVTTAGDYMKFLTMIAAGGRNGDHQILSKQAVRAMETVETLGMKKGYMPPSVVPGVEYALGNWCESWTAEKECTQVSSPGAFGTIPWIDRTRGFYGIIFAKAPLVRNRQALRAIRQAMQHAPVP